MLSVNDLLESHGWTIECECPFEIRNEDGAFASGEAAQIVVDLLRETETTTELMLRELVGKLQKALGAALDEWGIEHDINCVTMPPWDNPLPGACDCGRREFLRECRELIES